MTVKGKGKKAKAKAKSKPRGKTSTTGRAQDVQYMKVHLLDEIKYPLRNKPPPAPPDYPTNEEIEPELLTHVRLRRFEPSTMYRDAMIAIIGRRRFGKSTLMENIAYAMKFKRAVGLAGTSGALQQLKRYIPESYLHRGSIERLKHIIDERDMQLAKNADNPPDNYETGLLIDDMAPYKKFMSSEQLNVLASNGRWLQFCVIICIQYLILLSTTMRGNIDYIFVTRELSRRNRRLLFENWGGCCPTQKHFDKILDSCTKEFGCLVIDCTATGTEFEDYFYHYRADPDLPRWELGDESYRGYHDEIMAKKKRTQKPVWPCGAAKSETPES